MAIAKWLPPNGFTCTVHQMDGRVGGTFKMSFRNFSTGNSHSFGGAYLELSADQTIRYTDRFDDPNLPGEMVTTVSLRPVSCGVELTVVQEGLRRSFRSRCVTSDGRSHWTSWHDSWSPRFRMEADRLAPPAQSSPVNIVGPDVHLESGCEAVLRTLPKWFGIEPALLMYARDSGVKPTFALVDRGEVVGFLTLHEHFVDAWEIHCIAIKAVFPTLWNAHNPALQCIKILDVAGPSGQADIEK